MKLPLKIVGGLAIVACLFPAAASASTLSSTLAKLPTNVRVTSSFQIAAPQCVPDEYGYYATQCWEADLVFQVARKKPNGSWASVYRDSTMAIADFDTLRGTDTTRLYYALFRDHSWSRRVCRQYRVKVTLVDSFAATRNPTLARAFRACH